MLTALSCVAHVHSTYSDGTATVPEILAAARAAGARGVLLTDHNSLGARRDGWEGWHGDVLLVVGHEVTPPRGGHFLAFGLETEVPDKGRTESAICAEVVARGGVGFAAHPFSTGSRMSRRLAPPHGWGDLAGCREAGIELWSLGTDVAEGWHSLREAWGDLRDPEGRIDGPPADHLARWDALGARRRVAALGGLDAHQPGPRWRGRARSPMPHARWFRLLQTVVLLEEAPCGEADADVRAVVGALREGRCLLVRPLLGDPAGFAFRALGPAGELSPGAEAAAGDWTLEVASPLTADLRLLRDGVPIAHASSARMLHASARGRGVFRAEARRAGRTWVLTNPVYLR